MAKKIRKRTARLETLLSDGLHCQNWSEPLPGDQGWEVIHLTIGGGRNALILDMKENGYQVFVQDNRPAVETIEQEIARLCPDTVGV